MKDYLKLFSKTAIACFVLWHAFAVAVYSIPRDAKDVVSFYARENLMPYVAPYLFATSQWQLWNLFAPDPLRRVTTYHVETSDDGGWRTVRTYDAETFSIWRHSTYHKVLGNMLNEFAEGRDPLAHRFLHIQCIDLNLEPGTPIRLTYEYYVIPKIERPQSREWWNGWKPQPQLYSKYETVCPETL